MISICSLIYKSTQFADAVWDSLHEFTPHLHDRRARFFFVANDATPQLINHLRAKNYPFVNQTNIDRDPNELLNIGYAPPSYIHRVYKGWNRAIIESEEQLVLINSDMQFSPGWLEGLEKHWNENIILTSTLVERWQPKFGPRDTPNAARYFIEGDFGDHPKRFNKNEFVNFSRQVRSTILNAGRHFACVMFARSKAIKVGLYPEGNLYAPWGIRGGDQIFFNRLMFEGVKHLESAESIVYHFNEGEMVE